MPGDHGACQWLPGWLRTGERAQRETVRWTLISLAANSKQEDAAEFYAATFPDSEIRNVARTGSDGPITSAEFVVGGQVFMGYNGGPYFTFSEGFSLFVDCEDQAEVDEYWDKLIHAGAKPMQCGWINDPFGLSWQRSNEPTMRRSSANATPGSRAQPVHDAW